MSSATAAGAAVRHAGPPGPAAASVSRAQRDALIEAHRGLAEALARRYEGRGEDPDDLRQVAYLGLLKAASRYASDSGHAFPAFAATTIRGELRRHFRDATWAVHVPRRVQELLPAVRQTSERLEQRLGREPTLDEVASGLGVAKALVVEALSAGDAHRTLPLDRAEAVATPDESVAVERRYDLRLALAALGPRDRDIVRQRFVEGCTQNVIAARLGISQVHVSRLLRRAMERMRAELTA